MNETRVVVEDGFAIVTSHDVGAKADSECVAGTSATSTATSEYGKPATARSSVPAGGAVDRTATSNARTH